MCLPCALSGSFSTLQAATLSPGCHPHPATSYYSFCSACPRLVPPSPPQLISFIFHLTRASVCGGSHLSSWTTLSWEHKERPGEMGSSCHPNVPLSCGRLEWRALESCSCHPAFWIPFSRTTGLGEAGYPWIVLGKCGWVLSFHPCAVWLPLQFLLSCTCRRLNREQGGQGQAGHVVTLLSTCFTQISVWAVETWGAGGRSHHTRKWPF